MIINLSIEDRTRSLVDRFVKNTDFFKFKQFRIGIDIEPALAERFNGQVMVLTSLNLISRFSGGILIGEIPEIPLKAGLQGQKSNLKSELLKIAHQSNPEIIIGNLKNEKSVDALLAIGNTGHTATFKVAINSNGWIAELEEGPNPSLEYVGENSNPIGAQVAACFASAEIFKFLLRKMGSTDYAVSRSLPHISFSALDYSIDSHATHNPRLPSKLDFGEVTLVGVGAVGSSFINTLSYIPKIRGRLVLLDFDVVDVTNLNRYLSVNAGDIGMTKVAAASNFLKESSIETFPIQKSYESYIKEDRPDKRLDTVVSTVDNNSAREHIQSDLPRQILHGATHEQTCVISRHDFIHGACLGCLFYKRTITYAQEISNETGIPLDEVEMVLAAGGAFTTGHLSIMIQKRGVIAEKFARFIGQPFRDVYAKEICGTLGIRVEMKTEAATVSFVSALPGILLVGEILKDRIGKLHRYRLNNYLQMSLFSLKANKPIFRKKDPRCSSLCYEPIMIDRYNQKWMKTREDKNRRV